MTSDPWGELFHFDEPQLEFANGQRASDPHDGLALHGPYSAGSASHPRSPAYIVVGTPEGTAAFRAWSEAMNQSWALPDVTKHRLWPPYPGFDVAFGSQWGRAVASTDVDRAALLEASRNMLSPLPE